MLFLNSNLEIGEQEGAWRAVWLDLAEYDSNVTSRCTPNVFSSKHLTSENRF